MNDSISLTMIVKNEAENLGACLDSVQGQVDEIIIVDTGSTDGTQAIAQRYTPHVFPYPWGEDFSAARNYAIAKAKCAWIFSLDADEVLLGGSGALKEIIRQHEGKEAFLLPLDNPTMDLSLQFNRFPVLRLFKNTEAYRFSGNIHEQVTVPGAGAAQIVRGPVIRHRAPSLPLKNSKRARNLKLLNKALAREPENPFLHYYLGIEWLMLERPEKSLPFLRTAYASLPDENLLIKAPALRSLIICLKRLGKLEEALVLCLQADFKYPEFTDIYYLAGTLFTEKREFTLAIKWFRQALERGEPPEIYSHMQGTESYLSHYYLGYCHDMRGEAEAARRHYEAALNLNPQYPYPLISLFLNLRISKGVAFAYQYFNGRDYLHNRALAEILAGEFFNAGYPRYAREILQKSIFRPEGDKAKAQEQFLFFLGAYSLYTGELSKALDCFGKIPPSSAFYGKAQVKTAFCLLLDGRYQEARKPALALWRPGRLRAEGFLILKLIKMLQNERVTNLPLTIGNKDLGTIGVAWFKEMLSFLPQVSRHSEYSHFLRSLQALLLNLSPQSAGELINLIGEKKKEGEESCNLKYGGDSRWTIQG